MSTTIVRMPAPAIRLYRPTWAQRWDMFAQAWSAWREEVRGRDELRALAALDPRILKDVGLGEYAAPPSLNAAAWQIVERTRA